MEPATPSVRYNMKLLWIVCFVAAMGGLLFGYDWVVIGGAKAFYEPYFDIVGDSFWQGFAMSAALFGCILGAMMSGALTDKYGRKRLLILSGLLFTLSAVWTAACSDLMTFLIARFVGGLGIGLASSLSPMYIAEISPAKLRGRFVSINQLTIVVGILAAQVINLMIAAPVPTADQLRLLVNEESAVEAHVGNAEFDIATEKAAALEVTDEQALAAVAKKHPATQYLALDETAPLQTKQEKSDEDIRILTTYIRPTWNGQRGWRWMFGAETVPAFLFFLLMFFMPESPRWLVKNGRTDQAERILTAFGGTEHARFEVDDIRATIAAEEVAQVRFSELLEPKLLRILGLGVFLAVFQQWCGINVIFNYAQEIFQAAGYEVSDLMFSIVITGIVNLAFTFIAIFTVDRIGRRPLMLIGAAGLAGIYAVLGTGFYLKSSGIHMLILVVAAIACYAMSLAPITWVVISEIFPNRIRGAAMSVAVLSLWIACTILTFSFPMMKEYLGAHGAFWTYGVICVVGFFFILKHLPETKGKSLEDIEREFVD
jgi:MFS family permease